jgi:predicted extracellular nuclease
MHTSRSLTRRMIGGAAAVGLLGGLITVAAATDSVGVVTAAGPAVFINEIHYDNASSDIGEAVEIAGPAGTDLTGWTVALYNGSASQLNVSNTITLSGTIPNQQGGFGTLAFAQTGIQNGSPDGLALVDDGGAVIEFLSYEGSFTAGSGPASGMPSVDIGVSEPSSTPVGNSLQLSGSGSMGGDFSWAAHQPNTFDAVNTGQTFSTGGPPADPLINEFVANHTGADTNAFVEVLGDASTSYSAFTVLEIEGEGTSAGTIDAALTVGTTNGSGYWIDDEDMENATLTIMLVEGFTGSTGTDLDPDNDGVFNSTPWTRIVDDVATTDGNPADITYSSTVLGPFFDGAPFGPGGASRIPNGTDTDTTGDWTRNDFHGFGFPGFPGSPALGEAVNTPDAVNALITVPTDSVGVCGDSATLIHAIQGPGLVSPDVGSIREIEGIVVGDFQGSSGLNGFFVQEEDTDADGDAATSEGIFVFDPANAVALSVGDIVRVRGTVAEFSGLTEIDNVATVIDCDATDVASSSTITLPVAAVTDFEATEGMAVDFPQTLFASGNFTQARFGEVDLSVGGALDNPTNVVAPGAPANTLQALNNRSRIQLDDGSSVQTPLPLPPYLGVDNTLRSGDTVGGVAAVMSESFGSYELHPTAAVNFTRVNDRPDTPDVGGSMTVAAYNVLNYFTTIDNAGPVCGPLGNQDCRGADTADELDRQRDKIVAALAELDADVVGLMEIENPRIAAAPVDAAIEDLVASLNLAVGAGTYEYIDTGTIGGATGDAIKVALIYMPANVSPVGAYQILDSGVDPLFDDSLNRPVLAQSFQQNGTDDVITVAVNHLKSKGSSCAGVGDPDIGDGQGNCNQTRTDAAIALASWLAGDPTASGSDDNIIVGDLNSYAMEDPIVEIESAGYTDLVEQFVGTGFTDGAYSFNFFSQSGYLDHALASPSAQARVTGTDFWHVNADEPRGLDYNNFNQPLLYNPDPFRSSDHDPVVVGICEATAPVVSVTADPDVLWPPNHKYVDVSTTVDVTDADDNPTVTLLSVTSNEPDNATGNGDGNTVNDIVILDDDEFQLRAERSGSGDGRVYTITYEVTDACGNSTTASATVNVPKSK